MTKEERKIGNLMNTGCRILRDAFIENDVAESRHLMSLFVGEDLATIYANLDREVDEFTAMRYMKAIKKRASHYPLQYITGFTYFMDYEILCKENVLIPRYDTENLVERALEISPETPIRALDMCTGTGCIGISYSKYRQEEGIEDEIYLTDISDDALALAEENKKALKADVKILKSDIFDAFKDENGNPKMLFDLIMSNPPYIPTKEINNLMKDVRDFEPRLALDGTADGLYFYRRIVDESRTFLREGGRVVFEIGFDQYMSVRDILSEAGFSHIRKLKDMSGMDRVVSAEFT